MNIGCEEKVCNNCRYMLWLVGVGVGVKCGNDKNKVDGKLDNIPSRQHTCEYFIMKYVPLGRNNGKSL